MHLYLRVLGSLIKRNVMDRADSILVLAGGDFDKECMLDAKLTNVTISNIDDYNAPGDYAPYQWRPIDAERIDAEDGSYDWVVIHDGLHHLAVPALSVCEMFRVARKGILCFEARDSILMKLSIKFGLASDYELEPAFLSDGVSGGYRNGPVPNYVYRWTEREFEKTINSFAPTHRHVFFYDYGFRFPAKRFAMARSALYRLSGLLIAKLIPIAEILFRTQGNSFAFGVLKTEATLQPWLAPDLKFKREYMAKAYDKQKYQR